MTTSEVTTRLRDCALAIATLTHRVGMPPTIAEVSKEMGLRGVHAYPHVAALIAKGYAERNNGNRSLKLTAAGMRLAVVARLAEKIRNGKSRQKGK